MSTWDGNIPGAIPNMVNNTANQISQLRDSTLYNNAWSASQAEIQRDWQEQQNAKAMKFNANQAALNRDWQKMMSDTAHQREVRDLKLAGLNPVLSAMGGNGASVGSGATASGVTSSGSKGDTDTSMNSALVNLLGSVYSRTTQLEAANINARTQEAVADKYNATSELIAQLNAGISKYVAGLNYSSSIYHANKSYEASKYSSDMTKYIKQHFPDNAYSAVFSTIDRLLNGNGQLDNSLSGFLSGIYDDLKETSNYKKQKDNVYSKYGVMGANFGRYK